MKKTLSLLLAVMMIFTAVILAACSDGDDNTSGTTAATPAESTTSAQSTTTPVNPTPTPTETQVEPTTTPVEPTTTPVLPTLDTPTPVMPTIITSTPTETSATPTTTPVEPTTTPAEPTETPATPTPATPQELMNEAIGKTLALSEYEATIYVKSGDLTADYALKVNEAAAIGSRTVKAGDVEATVEIYMADGTVYLKKGDEKTKGSVESAEFGQYDLTLAVKSVVTAIPADIASAGEVSSKDGKTTVTISLTAEQFTNAFASFAADMTAQAKAMMGDDAALTITDAKAVVSYDENGYLADFTLGFDLAVGEKSAVVQTTVTFVNPGEAVTVTAPADLADYN